MGEATHEATAMTEDLKDELLREMEAAAKGATEGPWFHRQPGAEGNKGEPYDWIADDPRHHHKIIVGRGALRPADYAHVAASNPANVLALIARAERAEADATSLRAERDAAVAALEPFAKVGEARCSPDCRAVWGFDYGVCVTDDDFRQARAVVEAQPNGR